MASNTVLSESGLKDLGDSHWAKVLPPNQFSVLRRQRTEPRGLTRVKGGFDDFFDKGIYVCAACKTPLYSSAMKFACGCGWPGFWTNIEKAVAEKPDGDRTEITCSACRSHLGHIFRNEGFRNPPPNERHCVNSLSLAFIPENSSTEIPCTYRGPV